MKKQLAELLQQLKDEKEKAKEKQKNAFIKNDLMDAGYNSGMGDAFSFMILELEMILK